MTACALLYIQDIIARRQCSAIVSIPVRSNPRDFFFSARAQDDQRILGIVFSRDRRRVSIGKLDLPRRNGLQMSFHEARWLGGHPSDHRKDANGNETLKERRHDGTKWNLPLDRLDAQPRHAFIWSRGRFASTLRRGGLLAPQSRSPRRICPAGRSLCHI